MSRFVVLLVCAASLFISSLSAYAGERRHHRHQVGNRVQPGIAAGVTFRATVGTRPQIVVDRPKIARPIMYRKLRTVRPAKGCSVKQASAIAREFGIRYQTIFRSPRTMTIVGYRHGKKAKIRISRARGCAVYEWSR